MPDSDMLIPLDEFGEPVQYHRYCNDCEIVTFQRTCRKCGKPTVEERLFEDAIHRVIRMYKERKARNGG